MNYVDKYGLYNVKPVKEDQMPTGNDGWILTAYASKLGLDVDHAKLQESFINLPKISFKSNIPTRRLEYKELPPLSRDVILGLHGLGLITTNQLDENGWNFSPFNIPKFNLIELVKNIATYVKLYYLVEIKKDPSIPGNTLRNSIWANGGLPQLWRFAFSVPIQDRYYMLKEENKSIPLFYKLYHFFSDMLEPGNNSSKLIDWFKNDTEVQPIVFKQYFGETHPIYLRYLSKHQ